ncbi:hypothetical protein [Haploplasma axanthum]|uniref:Uncharacterized protein n=1 Tax=Haploplasma axanthum TaxID=29552 RepID=A0A449BF59_HAPAX|nr:hypothetical protein [Haploplasma axanthum]VEU81072.1 Uncharacterised protein [Haploplasma axanthum]
MLKLFKYNFKKFLKIHLILGAALIVNAIVLLILSQIRLEDNAASATITTIIGFFVSIFGLTQVLLIIFTFALTIINFKRKVLGDEGYLTHTLPVSKSAIINSYFLNALVYLIFDVFIIVLSSTIKSGFDFDVLFKTFNTAEINIGLTIFLACTLVLILYLTFLTQVILAFSIGYSKDKNKVANTILFGIVIYIVNQILGGILLAGIVGSLYIKGDVTSNTINNYLLVANIFYLFLGVISYTLINRFIKNKLNLE